MEDQVTTHKLPSSWMMQARYDHSTQELVVFTKSGKSYTLTGVPPDVVESFVNSSSPGQFFNEQLKGKY